MAEKLVPAASGIYIVPSMIVILSCLEQIPRVLVSMVSSVFRPETAAGGTTGYVISRSVCYDISQGVLLNEARLGMLVVLHGPTEGTTPYGQGMWAMFEVFFDTVTLCTPTALVILCMTSSSLETTPYGGAALAAWYLSRRLRVIREYLVSGSTVVFVFAIIMAWLYLGRQAAAYFTEGYGLRENAQYMSAARVYPPLFIVVVFLESEARLGLVWLLSDIWSGPMVSPNLTALLLLSREVTLPGGFLRRSFLYNPSIGGPRKGGWEKEIPQSRMRLLTWSVSKKSY